MSDKCPKCGHDSVRREVVGIIGRYYCCNHLDCKCEYRWHRSKWDSVDSAPYSVVKESLTTDEAHDVL